MTEVVKSYRIEAALAEELTRRAEARGENLSSFVARTLRELVDGKSDAGGPSPGAIDLEDLRSEMRQLGGLFRSERLVQAEIVDTLMALSKLTRHMERERDETVKVLSGSIEGLKGAKATLTEMVNLGGVVDKRCRESSAALEKLHASLDGSASKIHSFLGAMETTSKTCEGRLVQSQEELTKTLKQGVADTAALWKSNQEAVQEQARYYAKQAFDSTKGAFIIAAWATLLIAVLVAAVCGYQIVFGSKKSPFGALETRPSRVIAVHEPHPFLGEKAVAGSVLLRERLTWVP